MIGFGKEPGMLPITVEQVALSVKGNVVPPEDGAVPEGSVANNVVTDSRLIMDGSVFVAIAGENTDGHDYVKDAGVHGAVAAIVDHVVEHADVTQILVPAGSGPRIPTDGMEAPGTVKALGLLARSNIDRRRALDADFSVIGITGSVGKTTTKDLLKALLSQLGETVAPVGSFNNYIGLPLTALQVDADTRYLVAEMGANHIGEIAGLTRIVAPDVAVVLKVGTAHLGEFGSVEGIAQAKSEIVKGLRPGGVAVLNADDPRVSAMSRLAPGRVLWFGGSDREDSVRARDVSVDEFDRPRFMIDDGESDIEVNMGIAGIHNVSNALAAASVARFYGMSLNRVASALGSVRQISPHRMEVAHIKRGDADFTLIDDSFNANPDSLKAGLEGLRGWRSESERQPWRVAVLGAMLELGDDEKRLHHQLGCYAARLGLNAIVVVGSRSDGHLQILAQSMADGAAAAERDASRNTDVGRTPVVVKLVCDVEEADRLVTLMAGEHPGTVVLLKGSHASGLSALARRWSEGRQ